MGTPDEAALIAAAQAGDERALEDLLRRHHGLIYSVCRRMTGSDADAMDATQDALWAIAKNIRSYDGRAAFSTWSYRITTNACIDELRRRRRRPEPVEVTDEQLPPGDGPDFTQSVVDRSAIDAALAQLPPDFRAPTVLRDVLGLDYAEIAEVLGIPPGTVRSRISRARRLLAQELAGNQAGLADVEGGG